MKIFAISDLHLSVNNPKPMDIFGEAWDDYLNKIFSDWKEKVGQDDIVLLPGDFSWAMTLENTKKDFELLKDLPGKKIIIRGNHDYWWKSISGVRNFLPENFFAIQNDALKFGNAIICGTRGWSLPDKDEKISPENEKILAREVIRLDLTLANATKLKQNGEKIVCMMHYPPVNFYKQNSPFAEVLEKYKVDYVVYGHLHGYKNPTLQFERNGIEFFLTSCDLANNTLTFITESD